MSFWNTKWNWSEQLKGIELAEIQKQGQPLLPLFPKHWSHISNPADLLFVCNKCFWLLYIFLFVLVSVFAAPPPALYFSLSLFVYKAFHLDIALYVKPFCLNGLYLKPCHLNSCLKDTGMESQQGPALPVYMHPMVYYYANEPPSPHVPTDRAHTNPFSWAQQSSIRARRLAGKSRPKVDNFYRHRNRASTSWCVIDWSRDAVNNHPPLAAQLILSSHLFDLPCCSVPGSVCAENYSTTHISLKLNSHIVIYLNLWVTLFLNNAVSSAKIYYDF